MHATWQHGRTTRVSHVQSEEEDACDMAAWAHNSRLTRAVIRPSAHGNPAAHASSVANVLLMCC